jgi:hypothetical protein
LTITCVTFNSTGLGPSQIAAGGFHGNAAITTAENAMDAAITTVWAQTETFGSNPSTIQTARPSSLPDRPGPL